MCISAESGGMHCHKRVSYVRYRVGQAACPSQQLLQPAPRLPAWCAAAAKGPVVLMPLSSAGSSVCRWSRCLAACTLEHASYVLAARCRHVQFVLLGAHVQPTVLALERPSRRGAHRRRAAAAACRCRRHRHARRACCWRLQGAGNRDTRGAGGCSSAQIATEAVVRQRAASCPMPHCTMCPPAHLRRLCRARHGRRCLCGGGHVCCGGHGHGGRAGALRLRTEMMVVLASAAGLGPQQAM